MTSYTSLLLLFVVVIATSMVSKIHAEVLQEPSLEVRSLQGVEEERTLQRDLQRKLDVFNPEYDVCKNGVEDVYGTCDTSRFPNCVPFESSICYNRRPQRDSFYANRQPRFYIDYDNVYCYPNFFKGCSSCSPGRYCLSENRCILDEQNYDCEKWI